MVHPTAVGLTVPLSRAKDTTPLAPVLRVLGTRSQLETLQLLMAGAVQRVVDCAIAAAQSR